MIQVTCVSIITHQIFTGNGCSEDEIGRSMDDSRHNGILPYFSRQNDGYRTPGITHWIALTSRQF